MTKVVNLTPHALDILMSDGTVVKVQPSGLPPVRLKETTEERGTVVLAEGTVNVVAKRFGSVENLPEAQDGVVFVVSGIAGTAIWDLFPERRADVFIPGAAVRDQDGKIIGCQGFCCYY